MSVEEVKAVLRSGRPTTSTVATLKNLLNPEVGDGVLKSKKVPATKTTGTSKTATTGNARSNARSNVRNPKHQVAVRVLEDTSQPTSARDRFALATETANVCLKLLTDLLKSRNDAWKIPPATESAEEFLSRSPSHQQPLRVKSGNITPVRSSPIKENQSRSSPQNCRPGVDGQISALAQCADLGFSYLLSVDAKALGVKAIPRWQVETGLLALVGKLISYGITDLALKELQTIKRRLEAACSTVTQKKSKNVDSMLPKAEALSRLLQLDVDPGTDSSVMSLLVSYHFQAVRLLSLCGITAVLECLPIQVATDASNGPVDIVIRNAKLTKDFSKAAKQLDALSHAIFRLGPGVALSEDDTAKNATMSPSPATMLKLQTTALQIRKLWWRLAKYQPDVSSELLDPLLKCMAAYVRRENQTTKQSLGVLQDCFNSLGPFDQLNADLTIFCIHDTLYAHADSANQSKHALRWAEEMVTDCAALNADHARTISAQLRKATSLIYNSPSEGLCSLSSAAKALGSKIKGSGADYDILLHAIAGLSKAISKQSMVRMPDVSRILSLAATFCQRYARSYPDRNTDEIIAVLNTALQGCSSTDELLNWITPDTATAFVRVGSLDTVADIAASRPMKEAWKSTRDAASLSRVVCALLLKAIRSQQDIETSLLVNDDEEADLGRTAVILEWQLIYAAELAPKVKYHGGLKKVLPCILRRLAKSYRASDYPLRRARVASIVFGIREGEPHLIPPHVFKPWSEPFNIDCAALSLDTGLASYIDDITARISVSRTLSEAPSSTNELEVHLKLWRRILSSCERDSELCNCVDDPSTLKQQLRSVVAYTTMLGNSQTALLARISLLKLDEILDKDSPDCCTSTVELAKNYLDLGLSARAGLLFTHAESFRRRTGVADVDCLRCKVYHADYFLAVDDHAQCKRALEEASLLHKETDIQAMSKQTRKAFEIVHAQGWLIHSKLLSITGSSSESLASAKRAVQILNGVWSSVEREMGLLTPDTTMESSTETERTVDGLTKGVSKIQLGVKPANEDNKKGARFWPMVSPLVAAMLHLSDVYAHHGLFNEANYYSERAVGVSESVRSTLMLCRARSHRCKLLARAERLSDAELCIAADDMAHLGLDDFTMADRYCAEATIRVKEGSYNEAAVLFERAKKVLRNTNEEKLLRKLDDSLSNGPDLDERMNDLSLHKESRAGPRPHIAAKRAQRIQNATTKADSTKSLVAASKKPSKNGKSTAQAKTQTSTDYVLNKLQSSIAIESALAKLHGDGSIDLALTHDLRQDQMTEPLGKRILKHHRLMQEATQMFQSNVTLNLVSESTISLPALANSCCTTCGPDKNDTQATASRTASKGHPKTASTRSNRIDSSSGDPCEILLRAREAISENASADLSLAGSSQTHNFYSNLSRATLLLSGVAELQANIQLDPAEEAFSVDFPRIKALQLEKDSVAVDGGRDNDPRPLQFPVVLPNEIPPNVLAAEYQRDFVNILPSSWSAVSICLSDDASELHIVRYHPGKTPFILKLPFARHKPGDEDGLDESFDYHRGKAELKDIIDLSNYTCHNPGSLNAKGAKTKWWKEREELDRRMHELLINIENIWFGGFKSVFSLQSANEDALKGFKSAFNRILGRYLPSRRSSKGKLEHLELHDQVMDLFIGLGNDSSGALDLEEPVADLLYFVVDMLQFKGERNAYDEIDFDSMTIDVLDALRTYHEAEIDLPEGLPRHLVLVLDRRLQAFPWESLPCLDGISASRVGSMLSLRDCILSMRSISSEAGGADDRSEKWHVASRGSGTYILNPSSDLAPTQTMLEPSLSKLAAADGSRWKSITNREPTEDWFSSALTDSSILLYFGHGAGSQYIRPRTIKRLEQCSEVVWLMGCSSGAVWENGDLEPCAVPLSYLLAGGEKKGDERKAPGASSINSKCMSVVATLWDVTDKDVDRFSLAIGEEWGLWPASSESKLPAKTPKKREIVAQPSTPMQAPKTPKTPKVRKTPAAAKTPARGRSKSVHDGRKVSLVEAVARNRDVCYLRYLNGAAPVVYGIPVYLGD